MQAIILAAGMGKRLKELTNNNTKCMIKVNGVSLIDRMLSQLDKLMLNRIVIVVGYEGQKLIDYIATLNIKTKIVYVNNPIYDSTNNIYSLALAKDYLLQEDTLLLESDIIFEDSVLNALVDDPRDTLALVDKYESWMDGTVIEIGDDDSIQAFVPGKKFVFDDIPFYYKTVNLYKFSKYFSEKYYVPFLAAYSKALGNNEYYEQVLRVITMLENPEIKAKRLEGELWYEIDDIQDLDIASSMFDIDENKKVVSIQKRYGGYWRYPKLIDFCYLVNPYYPPQKLINEMKANFEKLLLQYPSGMEVNSLLAAKNFGVHQEHILVGNGAAELIKALMEKIDGTVGVIRPTFEEYPNRYVNDKCVVFEPATDDFSYTDDDVISYFDDKKLTALILINPDNPSGNYINKSGIMRLLEWTKIKGISFIYDESFADFADEPDNTLIREDVFEAYPNLILIKSISKSYGVPGVRLGILAAYNEKLIVELKHNVAIWNINSFGEFYMQIAEKYSATYKESLDKLRMARKLLVNDISRIAGIKVFPSQANFLMLELTNGSTAKSLTKTLLLKYNLFIKDLSTKIKSSDRQIVRIAVRSVEDNLKLANALKEIMR
jgi:histidinol-phosphate/aromatic aminotransferase/cobyric acid decarboxylase-like protein/choline kinase